MKSTERLTTIDLLKGIAICMIIGVHSGQRIANLSPALDFLAFGQMGCQIFFVLSGFTISLSYEKHRAKKRSNWSYIKNRYVSIAPGYYFFIFLILTLNLIFKNFGITLGFSSELSWQGVVGNLLLLQGILPFCNNVIAGGWYIGTLMVMYILFLILFPFYQREKKYFKYMPTAWAILSWIAVFVVYKNTGNKMVIENNRFVYFSFIIQMPCFLWGMTLYEEYKEGKLEGKNKNRYLIAGILTFLFCFVLFFTKISFRWMILPYFMGIATYCLFIGMIRSEKNEKDMRRIHGILERCGENSYYIYLSHPFFVWTMPLWTECLLKRLGVVYSGNILYAILIIPMFCGAIITANIFRNICKRLIPKQRGKE